MTTKDDYQCTNVETPNCYMEEKVINDVTCTNSVEFNCKRDKSTKNDGYGPKGVVCERSLHRVATTSPVRSKSRFARLMSTGTARNSLTSSPSLLKSRTAISNLRKSANWK